MAFFPYHRRANAKVESAVKVPISLIKKAFKDKTGPWKTLLNQINTPIKFLETRPAERLTTRHTRILLTTAINLHCLRVFVRYQFFARNLSWHYRGITVRQLSFH